MLNNRFLTVGILALASLLLADKSAHAQGYFYGYYYPDERRFETNQLEGGYDFNTVLPRDNIFSQSSPPAWMKGATVQREASPASIRMFLPDAKAKVWFDGTLTKSTGAVPNFTTPPLEPGTAQHYLIKLTYMLDGRETTQERTIAVMPGHTAMFHFPQSANKK